MRERACVSSCARCVPCGGLERGERLEFRGEFYTHTLMTLFFSPAEPVQLAC